MAYCCLDPSEARQEDRPDYLLLDKIVDDPAWFGLASALAEHKATRATGGGVVTFLGPAGPTNDAGIVQKGERSRGKKAADQ